MPSTGCTSLARRMAAQLIDGKAIAQLVRAEVREDVAAWTAAGHDAPGLATILVGEDAASAVYVGGKQKASAEVGIRGFDHRLPQDAAHDEVDALPREPAAAPRGGAGGGRGGVRDPAPAADAAAGRRPGADRADPAGQGRRRPHAGLRGPAC